MKIGLSLLGVWLILYGLMSIVDLSFRYDDVIMGVLAIVAGVFVFIRK